MQLFGGAIEIKLPEEAAGTHWIDCSSVRPVPDHQEVFMHSERNLSIIIEVLESSPMTAREHFLELAEMNEADKHELCSKDEAGNEEVKNEVVGWQDVRGEMVWIGVGVKREEQADLLVSVNSDKEEDMKLLSPLMRSLVLKNPKLFDEE